MSFLVITTEEVAIAPPLNHMNISYQLHILPIFHFLTCECQSQCLGAT